MQEAVETVAFDHELEQPSSDMVDHSENPNATLSTETALASSSTAEQVPADRQPVLAVAVFSFSSDEEGYCKISRGEQLHLLEGCLKQLLIFFAILCRVYF